MRQRINYKNIFGMGLAVPAFTLAAVGNAQAQECAALPTCEEFGYLYTAEECAGQKYVKCPFDQTKYFCLEDNTSSGNCANPNIGDILYSDMSCSSSLDTTKTPIGVIFNPTFHLAIALKTTMVKWSTIYFNVPDLTDYSSSDSAKNDWAGKSNTNIVVSYCAANSKSCPAFDYVNSYSTAGTKAGDWYLPAMGEVNSIYENIAVLNSTLSIIGGTQLPTAWHWSSSEYGYHDAWEQYFGSGSIDYYLKGNYSYYVRPVLAF